MRELERGEGDREKKEGWIVLIHKVLKYLGIMGIYYFKMYPYKEDVIY